MTRPRIALLSNPKSTGNIAQLSRIRDYCAEHPDIFHYEVERAEQIGGSDHGNARIVDEVRQRPSGRRDIAALLAAHDVGVDGPGAPVPKGRGKRQDQA